MSGPGRAELNGAPATADQLAHPAVVNYGHFTSMQVDHGRVRGLAAHLRRLADATRLLFGRELDVELVRAHLRQAVAGAGAVTARVTVFSSRLTVAGIDEPLEPDVLVTTGPPAEGPDDPLRLRTVEYERFLPEVKHVGTFGLLYHMRAARRAGYDDALFTDRTGHVSEGSVWNVGFFDGTTVLWPAAPMLDGITQQLVRAGLDRLGVPAETRPVPLAEVHSGRWAAFFLNSRGPYQPVASVDDMPLPLDPDLGELLAKAYELSPLDEI